MNAPTKVDTAHIATERIARSLRRVRPMMLKLRHHLVAVSFGLVVMVPAILATLYLYLIAADQYSSEVAFTVRSEEFQSPLELLGGGLGAAGNGTASDADILYDYILSQGLVANIDAQLDLEEMYSRPAFDPIFAFQAGQPIEELAKYWERMVHVAYDQGAGMIKVETFAFTPEDAHLIAEAIVRQSDNLVNELSRIAREDTTRSAEEDLRRGAERLKEERIGFNEFRRKNRMIDPLINLEAQMATLTILNQELTEALVQKGTLSGTTRPGDPRLRDLDRRIASIRSQIASEEERLSSATAEIGDDSMVSVIGQYESLKVDLEFAQQSYVAMSAAYDAALAEARRRSRYLATHIQPTIAESAQYPRRFLLSAATFGALFLIWAIGVLSFYAARDR